jgi:hypothetical protein
VTRQKSSSSSIAPFWNPRGIQDALQRANTHNDVTELVSDEVFCCSEGELSPRAQSEKVFSSKPMFAQPSWTSNKAKGSIVNIDSPKIDSLKGLQSYFDNKILESRERRRGLLTQRAAEDGDSEVSGPISPLFKRLNKETCSPRSRSSSISMDLASTNKAVASTLVPVFPVIPDGSSESLGTPPGKFKDRQLSTGLSTVRLIKIRLFSPA